jgi:hypothetical protein
LLARVFPEPAIVPTVLTPTAAKQIRASKRRRDFNLIFIDDVLPGFDPKLELSHCSNGNEFEPAAAFGRICEDEFSTWIVRVSLSLARVRKSELDHADEMMAGSCRCLLSKHLRVIGNPIAAE